MSERGRQLSSIERKFFAALFARFEQSGIPTVFLRNFQNFPEEIGHDLDVFFRRADLPGAFAAFRQTLREFNGELLHIHRRDYVFAVWFRAHKDEPLAIHLDFYHGAFTWHGLPYLSEAELVSQSRSFGAYKVPRPAHEALNLFLTSLLWGGFFKLRYRERIHALLQMPGESQEFQRLLESTFGPGASPPLDFADSSEPDRKAMRRYAAHLRRGFKRRSFLCHPFVSVFRQGRYWTREFGTVISPPGICIAFLGPDGSGKSTVIQAVKERIEYYFGEVEDRHWRPDFLRDIGVLLGKREKSAGPVSDPHGRAPHSPAVSLLRFFYYWLDYWLGWLPRVRKFKAKNHLVIFDRYAQDMWCDPQRYRLRLPRSLMKFFCRVVPQPDLTFVLLADAETIHKRKGEVPLESLRQLLVNYGKLARSGGRIHPVDCSRTVAEIADDIAATVMRKLRVATAVRYSD